MHFSKNLLAVTTAAMAVLAFSAAAASADTGATITGPGTGPWTLTAGASSSVFSLPSAVGGGTFDCNVDLGEIAVNENGSTEISGVSITAGDLFCANVTAVNEPWADQICSDGAGGFYDKIAVDLRLFGLIPITGELRADLDAAIPSAASVHGPIGSSGYSVDAELSVENLDGIEAMATDAPCPSR